MKSNRITMIVGVVVIAAVVGFLALRNNWPPKSGTEGAIGAANRYTAQQISDQDVTLKDEKVQAFLQSDTFHQLATNPEFKTFVEEMVARGSAGRAGIGDRLNQAADALGGGFRIPEKAVAALEDSYFTKLTPPQVEALLSKGGLALLGDGSFAQAIESKQFRQGAAKGVPEAIEAVRNTRDGGKLANNLGDFLNRHPNLLTVLSDEGFGKWIKGDNSQALVDALNKPTINNDALAAALGDGVGRRIIILEGAFQNLGDSKVFISALKDEGFQMIMGSNLDLSKTLLPRE